MWFRRVEFLQNVHWKAVRLAHYATPPLGARISDLPKRMKYKRTKPSTKFRCNHLLPCLLSHCWVLCPFQSGWSNLDEDLASLMPQESQCLDKFFVRLLQKRLSHFLGLSSRSRNCRFWNLKAESSRWICQWKVWTEIAVRLSFDCGRFAIDMEA